MTKTYPGLLHLNGNLLCSVDLETTGRQPGWHEICQIACVPLGPDLKPSPTLHPFYTEIKPNFPERAEKQAMCKHGIPMERLLLDAPEQDKVKDLFVEWFESLDLPFKRSLVPMAHNWAFESSWLKEWLGITLFDELWFSHARDGMLLAIAINDKAAMKGEALPFNRVGLGSLCNKFNIVNINAHDALSDAIAEAEVYRALLQLY
jgi:DNA polymerase III epsilon subunit-like protein